MSITQGYRGSVDLGTAPIRMPVMPGSTFSIPMNYQFPPVAHNMAYQYTRVRGLQVPVANLSLLVTEAWFSAVNLEAWLMTRVNDDTGVIAGGGEFWDGASGYEMTDIKVNTLVLGSSQGQPISATMMLMMAEPGGALTAPTYTVITEHPLDWSRVSFTNIDSVVAWQLMITNSCTPNPIHASSYNPSEINAGRFLASLRLTLLAEATPPVDGVSFAINIAKPTAAKTVTFTAVNPLCLTPNERAIHPDRAFRQYDYALLGSSSLGVEVKPLTITEA